MGTSSVKQTGGWLQTQRDLETASWFLTCTWGPLAFQDLPGTPSSSLCLTEYCWGFLEAHRPENPKDTHEQLCATVAHLRVLIVRQFILVKAAECCASRCPPLRRQGWCGGTVLGILPGSRMTYPPTRPETWWPASSLWRSSNGGQQRPHDLCFMSSGIYFATWYRYRWR